MPTPGQELSSIDFESMIGGPLVAVINAQAQAAMSTVNFIKEVGFKKPDDIQTAGGDTETAEPIYVTFTYPKELSPYVPAVQAVPGGPGGNPAPIPASPAVPAVYEEQELKVPLLTLLPIPFIRIDVAEIDFNAKINSIEYRKTDTNLKIDASVEASAGWFFGSAKLKVSTSFQRNTSQGLTVDRTYSLAIHVKAVQDEMPAGMEKVLGILESAITSTPK
jgi:hypothetical protein